jgi:hypothetical protein
MEAITETIAQLIDIFSSRIAEKYTHVAKEDLIKLWNDNSDLKIDMKADKKQCSITLASGNRCKKTVKEGDVCSVHKGVEPFSDFTNYLKHKKPSEKKQCQGTTKKKTQCLKSAVNGTDFCNAHQGGDVNTSTEVQTKEEKKEVKRPSSEFMTLKNHPNLRYHPNKGYVATKKPKNTIVAINDGNEVNDMKLRYLTEDENKQVFKELGFNVLSLEEASKVLQENQLAFVENEKVELQQDVIDILQVEEEEDEEEEEEEEKVEEEEDTICKYVYASGTRCKKPIADKYKKFGGCSVSHYNKLKN